MRKEVTEETLYDLLKQELSKHRACHGAIMSRIVPRSQTGDWTVHLEGNPSGGCQRAFLTVRSELQHLFALKLFTKGGRVLTRDRSR